jgi:hypothetical protein
MAYPGRLGCNNLQRSERLHVRRAKDRRSGLATAQLMLGPPAFNLRAVLFVPAGKCQKVLAQRLVFRITSKLPRLTRPPEPVLPSLERSLMQPLVGNLRLRFQRVRPMEQACERAMDEVVQCATHAIQVAGSARDHARNFAVKSGVERRLAEPPQSP